MSWKSIKNYWSDKEAHRESLGTLGFIGAVFLAIAVTAGLSALSATIPAVGLPLFAVVLLGTVYALAYSANRW